MHKQSQLDTLRVSRSNVDLDRRRKDVRDIAFEADAIDANINRGLRGGRQHSNKNQR